MASLPLPLGPGLKRGPPSSPLWGEPVGQEEPGVDTASPSCRCSFSRPGLSQGPSLPPAPLALMSCYGLTRPDCVSLLPRATRTPDLPERISMSLSNSDPGLKFFLSLL